MLKISIEKMGNILYEIDYLRSLLMDIIADNGGDVDELEKGIIEIKKEIKINGRTKNVC